MSLWNECPNFVFLKVNANVDEGSTQRDPGMNRKVFCQTAEQMFYILKYSSGSSATEPGFHLFRNDTMAILNKKPMGIHNEWAQPNSFPWCEIVLSTCNQRWLCSDKKHPHAFLIDPSSLKARKSLYASDHPSLETGNDVGATLEMLMPPAQDDAATAVNKTRGCDKEGALCDRVCRWGDSRWGQCPSFISVTG